MSFNPLQQSSAFIDHARDVVINGGNFHQHNIQYLGSSNEIGLALLRQAISLTAMHDSSGRDPPPRCAEGTRKQVIVEILTWIKDPNPRESVLWLNGPFGNGKSAIMQTITETLRNDPQMSHLLAGSFFFGRQKPGRDKASYLIPTIAYQIATNIPGMRKAIEEALGRDPTILSKSIEAQLRYLITEPFRTIIVQPSSCDQSSPSFHTPTVIIDGLDECDGHDFQRQILSAISTAVFKDHVKLRFLIASRPERQISEPFRAQPLHQQHLPITLVDDHETRDELKQHMRAAFDGIYERHSDLMFSVKKPWPSDKQIAQLAYRASGQFLYASTALKFVDSEDAHPVDQLNLVLTRQSTAFSNMDELYTLILESCLRQDILPSFLCALVYLRTYHHSVEMRNLETLSGLRTEDISVLLRRLPAIIAVEKELEVLRGHRWGEEFMRYYSPTISVHHQSFIEFLSDKQRSGRIFSAIEFEYDRMFGRLDNLVAECLSQSRSYPQHIYPGTWDVISSALRHDLLARGIHPAVRWPHLWMFLEGLGGCQGPPFSNDFFDALSTVLQVLQNLNEHDNIDLWTLHIVDIERYRAALTRLFDMIYLEHFPLLTTQVMWKIAGLTSLLEEGVGFKVPEDWSQLVEIYLVPVSQVTGFSVQTIFQTLRESHHLFNIFIFREQEPKENRYRCEVLLKPVVKGFLLDEARSGYLYLAYRNAGIHEFRSQVIYTVECLKFDPFSDETFQTLEVLSSIIFVTFVKNDWNIRIDVDMQEGSPMRDAIKTLHAWSQYDGETAITLCNTSSFSCEGSPILRWLCQQLCIVKVLATPGHERTVNDLQGLIDFMKDNAIGSSFRNSRRWPMTRTDERPGKLPPFGVRAVQLLEDEDPHLLASTCQRMHTFYLETFFLWNGMESGRIIAETHAAIVEYYIFVLLSSMVCRNLSDDDRTSLFAITVEVHWEFHLSNIPTSLDILNHILTVHYLCVKRNDLICVTMGDLLEWVPLSFLKASLVWFKKYHDPDTDRDEDDEDESDDNGDCLDKEYQGQGFELWCEQAIAAKERAARLNPMPSTIRISTDHLPDVASMWFSCPSIPQDFA